MHLLEMSHLFDVQEAREYAMRKLNTRIDFTPTKRLWCARKFWIEEWVKEGISKLLQQSLEKIDVEEWLLLEQRTLLMLWQGQARIDTHRRNCALRPPAVEHDDLCYFQTKCTRAWREIWLGTPDNSSGQSVLRALIHPDRIPIAQIVQKLQEMDIGDMHKECRDLTVAALAKASEEGGKFRREEAIIAEIVVRFNNGE